MPWRRVKFKNNKAYAKVDAQNKIVVTTGRVEIRYKPDDSRTYKAALSNIKEIAGEEPVESNVKSVEPAKKKPAPKKAVAAKVASSTISPHTGEVIEAWTDGACSGNPGDAGSGVVLLFGKNRLEISHYLGKATNNIAELEAIHIALKRVKDKSKALRIFTDSSYSLGVLTKGWKAKKNPELVAQIKERIAEFSQLEFVKVSGHAGVEENEKADELARLAVANKSDYEERL